ncbi:esterase-like activity of phytase family protein [Rhizobium straminoryzae]|uniref:Esterase-like activity of phytase family protein n=1 Tax=Rhizobium straminoryzae TaxID=1387186 RepID=A0A549TGG8_9HYPH|nr:esterase-like activity of phytase family protein [Rhizobium straminoryzae]TRL41866.1 esterase-like activity of phytase family protein [Rhizobium straminoryzae]
MKFDCVTFGRGLKAALAASVVLIPVMAFAETSVSGAGVTVTNKGLVAIGRIPASQRDKFGETFGSGSGMAIDPTAWKKDGAGYTGALWLLPDRGYNVEGTTDYNDRLNRIEFRLTPATGTPAAADQQKGMEAKLADTILLLDDKGKSMTGLDPESGVRAAAGKLPPLPEARTGKVSLDPEAVVRLKDGSFLISDEYGPYIYHFGADGKMISATQPPKALLPMRKGELNFSSNNVDAGGKKPDPKDPDTGRQNNQGLEGMSITPDGKFVVALLQSATRQDGGDSSATRINTRALVYDATDIDNLKLVHEYVVPLPTFDNKGKVAVAAQSEILALSDKAFLMLARDSNNGQGLKGDTSVYRKIDLVDLSAATDIANSEFDGMKPVAPKGVVDSAVKVAAVTPFIDLNDNAELGRFGLHNGAPNDKNNLSEKWEAMSIAPVLDASAPDDYFLFVANDNDFLTQDGFQVGAAYKADGGADVDTMFQVFRVTLPGMAK